MQKIRKKLILGAMAISLLSAIIISVSIYELEMMIDGQKMILKMHRPAMNALNQMKTSLFDATQEAYAYVLLNSPEEKDGFYSAMNVFDDMLEQDLSIEKSFGIYHDEIQTLEQIKILKKEFMKHAETMFSSYEKNSSIDAESAKLFEDSKNSILLKVDALINSERDELRDIQDSSVSNSTSSVYMITILSGVTLFSIIIFSIVFSRKFTKTIEEKIRLERQLGESNAKLKNEKLAAIGEIASRMAHDLKNPLNVIKTCLALLKISPQNSDEKNSECLQRIEKSADNMQHQIEDVMNFVRTKPLQLDWHPVSEMIKSAISGVNKPESVIIEVKNPDETLKIQCDAQKIEVLLSNLITNALQAMDDQGKVTITVKEQEEFVSVEVQDTGPGIPNEIMDKIFEPLFTTKQTGTGLGLASVKNIVEQHGGTISVRNNPTTFEVRLSKKIKNRT
ncbi:MAG: HAMP domain-containing histidine kinase [Candidatus Nitrosotenuis sp.]|nr:MAG: HAMP domain-containing histidine kinase [Candidatus Nitrosotenuis sp.]